MLQGIASMIGAPMVGAVYDAVGTFDLGFYIAGGFFIAASFCGFAAQTIHRKKAKQSEHINNLVNGPIEVSASNL